MVDQKKAAQPESAAQPLTNEQIEKTVDEIRRRIVSEMEAARDSIDRVLRSAIAGMRTYDDELRTATTKDPAPSAAPDCRCR